MVLILHNNRVILIYTEDCNLRRIYPTSEISVRASESQLGRNQNKWIDVSCLHWSQSESEIFVSDVRVRARRYM